MFLFLCSYVRSVCNVILSLIVPAYKTHSCSTICIITDNSFPAYLHLPVASHGRRGWDSQIYSSSRHGECYMGSSAVLDQSGNRNHFLCTPLMHRSLSRGPLANIVPILRHSERILYEAECMEIWLLLLMCRKLSAVDVVCWRTGLEMTGNTAQTMKLCEG